MSPNAKNTRDYALVVGINHYPEYKPLQGAINDANDVAEWLIDENGGNLPPGNCVKILSLLDPLNPNQDLIDNKLEKILNKTKETGGRRFYFYFAGHGLGIQFDDNSLCLAAWHKRRGNLALSSREYLLYIMNSGLFKEVIFLLDCCRTTLVNHRGLFPTLWLPEPSFSSANPKKFVAYATRFQDSAYEAALEEADPETVRGHFTAALIAGLKGQARDDSGRITPGSLKDHLEEETVMIARAAGKNQRAEVDSNFSKLDEVVFGPVERSSKTRDGVRGVTSEFSFRVTLSKPSGFTRISILDEIHRVVHREYGSATATLPAGEYTVRAALNGQIKEKVVLHDGDSTVKIDTPDSYSAALLQDFSSSHEYYTVWACHWSQDNTTDIGTAAQSNKPGALFIFLRYSSQETFEKLFDPGTGSLGKGFALLDGEGRIICPFSGDKIKEDLKDGWLAFSTPAAPGLYFLEYSGKTPRQVPLYVYEKRQTQVFVTLGREPLFNSMRIFTKAGTGFDWGGQEPVIIDTALKMLQNGDYNLPRDLLASLFSRDAKDPILGLLAGYLNCHEAGDRDLMQQIINDLEQILKEDSPDLRALKTAAARYFGSNIPDGPFGKPPLMRLGMEAIIKESVEKPDLIPGRSLVDIISPSLYSDTPWTTWEPGPLEGLDEPDSPGPRRMRGLPEPKETPPSIFSLSESTAPDWVQFSLRDTLASRKKSNRPTNLKMLAEDLQLSPNTIERILTGLKSPDGLSLPGIESLLSDKWADVDVNKLINSLNVILEKK